jgi:Fe2+ transport system protein B
MNCNDYSSSIMGYFDGNLNDIESAQLKQHLKACKNCSCEFEDMKLILNTLENDNKIEPPEDFEVKVMDRIKTIQHEWKKVPDNTIKFIYGFTTFLLVLLLFMFTMNIFMGEGVLEAITTRFSSLKSFISIIFSMYDFAQTIISVIGDLAYAIVRMVVIIVKAYYYILILVAVMLFAIQWMYVSLIRQFQGGHTR